MTVATLLIAAAARDHERGAGRCASPAAQGLPAAALMEGVLERLAAARGCQSEAARARLLEEARSIMGMLQGMLRGGLELADAALAANLDDVYEYMARQLAAALREDHTTDLLGEVAHLMHEIRAGWLALPHVVAPHAAGG